MGKASEQVPFKRLNGAQIADAIPIDKVVKWELAMFMSVLVLGGYQYVWGEHTDVKEDFQRVWATLTQQGAGEALTTVATLDGFSQCALLNATVVALTTLLSWVRIRGEGEKGSDPGIVDSWWSVTPFIFTWVYYLNNPSPRGLIMTVIATTWGSRLSYNAWKKVTLSLLSFARSLSIISSVYTFLTKMMDCEHKPCTNGLICIFVS